ncbi:NAD-dependent epimerase/dehydratase family protein [uncultured Jatrophihabitans sp.]|uniref:NAD-dependent epimerase/dehydratase family protein n=1 Tax=uncultured Jatrophihabitans sp. TaxID=1610747 RepID=UPI0035C9AF2B
MTGAGGFIGGHLVRSLLEDGQSVRAVDVKPLGEWHQLSSEADNVVADVSLREAAFTVAADARVVYNLAADMGGMGFIENNRAACMLSVLTSTHVLMAAHEFGAQRYFYSSSACVYAAEHQTSSDVVPLKESDAYPAMPEDGYGWEKLFSERMCRHFYEDFGLQTRVARYHNVYGEQGTWNGGREKAPAAICRKVAMAKLSGNHDIDIWGDGEQTRSFMYVDDCVKGTRLITDADSPEPVNLGSAELVSINQLVSIVEQIAGVKLARSYNLTAPQGVRGRSSDNAEMVRRFGWEPSITLQDGLERTYKWIYDEVAAAR